LKECLAGTEGVSTDTIYFGDLGLVIFVLARHLPFVQGHVFLQQVQELAFSWKPMVANLAGSVW
jgi:hypothetical protein